MTTTEKNYYGNLCTEMYEILHPAAPADELDFYLSYAKKGEKILEPLCGSGRFMVPMLKQGYDVSGMDASAEMLAKLIAKIPGARVTCATIENYASKETFDYIFISSGSMSLFTDMDACKNILRKMRGLLKDGGKFVFAVDTISTRSEEQPEYKPSITVSTKEGYSLVLKGKNHYDEATQTQYGPSIYELWDGGTLLQSEPMDFQLHLYRFGEMEEYLREAGFGKVITYAGFDKTVAADDKGEMFLFECEI